MLHFKLYPRRCWHCLGTVQPIYLSLWLARGGANRPLTHLINNQVFRQLATFHVDRLVLVKYADMTLKARPVTLHHSDTGKSDREEVINHAAGYEGGQSDVLGTWKCFSFKLIASLNRHRGVCSSQAACLSPGLVTNSETEKWLITANSATPVLYTETIFYTSEKSHSIAVPAHLWELRWQ